MRCRVRDMSLTESDPRGQESLTDPDDWPVADPGSGLSLQCHSSSTEAVSLHRVQPQENNSPSAAKSRNQQQQSEVEYNTINRRILQLYIDRIDAFLSCMAEKTVITLFIIVYLMFSDPVVPIILTSLNF